MSKSRSSSLSTHAANLSSKTGANQSKFFKTFGDDIWKNKIEKVNAELFIMTYGVIVQQLCQDFNNDYMKINENLFSMGYNIGVRLIEDFLARTALPRCPNMIMTSEVITKVAFKVFLNITPVVDNWSSNKDTFSLILVENPLAEFVDLPHDAKKQLWYSNIICGVLKGALEMVQLDCDIGFVSDVLRGDASTEIRVKLNKILKDEIPLGED
ncbi:TRAPP complex core subunit BET3 PWA37_004735 [Arxiozyma heterogenica]|uniref:Trafficking protein particle complex subunit BET3 n=1 Tax=Arxiozyma heterogenica TaxID=278026 RepID=A0AAN7WQ71_9SACH|nr:hypothetical protein RI543_001142 [Kazachstania heterogenica]